MRIKIFFMIGMVLLILGACGSSHLKIPTKTFKLRDILSPEQLDDNCSLKNKKEKCQFDADGHYRCDFYYYSHNARLGKCVESDKIRAEPTITLPKYFEL